MFETLPSSWNRNE